MLPQDVGQDEQVCEGLPGQLHSAQVEHSEPTLCANRVPAALGVGTVLASTMIVTVSARFINACRMAFFEDQQSMIPTHAISKYIYCCYVCVL